MQIMLTDIAQKYAEVISKNQDAFVIGFVDAWHQQEHNHLRNDNILHDANIAYDIGYQIGSNHRSVWTPSDESED